MPGLTYTLKADATGIEKGLQTAKQKVEKFQRDVNKASAFSSQGRQGGTLRGIGGASLQAQDIAVQMQMGTKASTILMQQGTQLLSVFGPAGAIAGGLLGIGILAYNAFSGGAEEAEKLRIKVDELSSSLGKASAAGNKMGIASALKNISAEMDALKSQAADLQSGYFSPADQKKLVANLRAQGELYWQSVTARRTMLDLDDDERVILDHRLKGENDIADELERQKKLKAEIAGIRALGLDRVAEEQLVDTATAKSEGEKQIKEKERVAKAVTELLEGIEDDENSIAKRRKEAAKKTEEDIQDQIKKSQEDDEQLTAQRLKREEEAQKEREKIAQRQADAEAEIREQGAKDFEAAEKKKQDAIEARMTLDDRTALARERVAKAQKAALAARGTVGQEAAEAKLAEAQGGLQDVREEQIQRIMGGSTSAAAAQRAERREKRARARAERIIDKRQAINDHDARARGEKPAEMNIQGGPQKDPILNAVKEGNTMLGKVEQQLKDLNVRLTVA